MSSFSWAKKKFALIRTKSVRLLLRSPANPLVSSLSLFSCLKKKILKKEEYEDKICLAETYKMMSCGIESRIKMWF
jgi:hypothetical protein